MIVFGFRAVTLVGKGCGHRRQAGEAVGGEAVGGSKQMAVTKGEEVVHSRHIRECDKIY